MARRQKLLKKHEGSIITSSTTGKRGSVVDRSDSVSLFYDLSHIIHVSGICYHVNGSSAHIESFIDGHISLRSVYLWVSFQLVIPTTRTQVWTKT